jgi:ABC-type transport system involved in multi-copper enzyme maturation permease subunit
MRMNPVLVKELRGRMRGWRALLVMTIYLGVMSIITLLIYLASRDSVTGYGGGQSARIGQVLFYGMVIFQMVMVALLTPAFTSSAITQEREQKTYELLVTTLLPSRSIVLGKLGAALAYVGLLIIAVAPLESLAFMFGGVSPEEIVLSQVVVLMSAVLFASAGVFWSSIMKSSVASNVLTYGTMLFQMLGIPFLFLTLTTAFGLSQFGFGMAQDAGFYQFSMIVLSLQPIIAMAFSEAHYLRGDPLFIFTTDDIIQGENLLIVSPWLIFCIEALLLSALFVWLAVKKVPPVRYKKIT